MLDTLKKPTEKEKKDAMVSVIQLRKITSSSKLPANIKLEIEGETMSIPKRIMKVMTKVLGAMAEGKEIEITYSSPELSTQDAADFLNVSRPHLVKLLETKQIPFRKVGSHRRVLLEDLQAYRQNLKEIRRKSLDQLAKEAQELGLGY